MLNRNRKASYIAYKNIVPANQSKETELYSLTLVILIVTGIEQRLYAVKEGTSSLLTADFLLTFGDRCISNILKLIIK